MDEEITTARALHERLDEVQVVDVREPFEWEAGRIEGSVHVPLNDVLAGRAEGLDPERPIVVVCSGGNRSELATMMLRARGLEAYNLSEGLREWESEGLPLTTPSGEPGRVA